MDWQGSALCAEVDPDMWFPDAGGASKEYLAAKALCQRCPIRAQCLAFALEHHEDHGIWGGLAPSERRALVPV